jgi:hypothetical protein
MQADIYALYSTRDGRVRYVGESGDRIARFKDHLQLAESSPNRCPLSKWFHQEWRDGYLVRYALLDVCDYDRRYAVETEWIWRFPWIDLLNQRKKRPWWWSTPVPKPPVIPEIARYVRRYIFNVEGFRGVHYDRETSYYRVLVYNGRWAPQWLHDDELADGQWFSDLARAVNARDKHFNRAAYMRSRYNRALIEARRGEDIVASRARYEERIRKEQGGYDYVWD